MKNVPASAWRTFAITVLAVFMVSLDSTVVVAVFPALRHSFTGTPEWMLSWILNGYTIVYASLLVPAGRWVDRMGHKKAFVLGVIVFTFSSGLCAMSQSIAVMIAARALQAAGAAVLTPAALALTLEAFPPQRRPVAVGLWSAAGALAAAFGPALGSWLAEMFSWPMIFWINLPTGLMTVGLAVILVQRPVQNPKMAPPDLVGSLLLMAMAGSFCIAVVRGPDQSLSATLGTMALACVLLGAFLLRSRRHPSSAQDMEVFRHPNFALANVVTLIFGASFATMFLSFFYFMTGVWHFSQSHAGLAATPGPLLVIPTAILAGRLAVRTGQGPLLILGGLLFAASQLWYLVSISENPAYWSAWLPGQVVSGVAVGLLLPSLTSQALMGLPAGRLGLGSAAISAVRQFGAAIGVAVTVAVLGAGGITLDAFQLLYFLMMSAGLVIAGLATAFPKPGAVNELP